MKLRYLGGRIDASMDTDLAVSPPAITLDVKIHQLSLERLFEQFETPPVALGPLDLTLSVTASGTDGEALLASMNGRVVGSILGGSLSDQIIDLVGQNIVVWMFTPTATGSAPLVCLVAEFDFKNGVGTANRLVFETQKVQVVGGGTLDLRDETMDFMLMPRAKRPALVDTVGPVQVTGPISEPNIKMTKGGVVTKVVVDTVGLPIHLLGAILGSGSNTDADHKPCIIIEGSSRPTLEIQGWVDR